MVISLGIAIKLFFSANLERRTGPLVLEVQGHTDGLQRVHVQCTYRAHHIAALAQKSDLQLDVPLQKFWWTAQSWYI